MEHCPEDVKVKLAELYQRLLTASLTSINVPSSPKRETISSKAAAATSGPKITYG